MNKLYRRLLDICYENKLHHLGSYFSCLHIIDDIYKNKKEDDIFILSNGHAVVALYVILEEYYGLNAQELLDKYGEHPKRNELDRIHCSTGSLGMGICVAVGRAVGNPNRHVHVMISDGESNEGSVWEALRYISDSGMQNITVHVNANGWAAYDPVDLTTLENRVKAFCPSAKFHKTTVEHFGLEGLHAHYTNFTEEQYKEAIASL
jgi:transketolase|tara:strand:+ start:110 stop:727 length:618 start_codon:yes stop_codon:yes gene_type:complete